MTSWLQRWKWGEMEEVEEEESGASSLSSLALCLPVLLHLSLSLLWLVCRARPVRFCSVSLWVLLHVREGDRTAVAGGVSTAHTLADTYIHPVLQQESPFWAKSRLSCYLNLNLYLLLFAQTEIRPVAVDYYSFVVDVLLQYAIFCLIQNTQCHETNCLIQVVSLHTMQERLLLVRGDTKADKMQVHHYTLVTWTHTHQCVHL